MSKITLVTDPDDILEAGIRLVLIDLNDDQETFVSQILSEIDLPDDLIIYNWKVNNDIKWLLDKRLKANCVIFNAESSNQTLVGYVASFKNSYYLGTLRDLFEVNKSAIQDREFLKTILINLYE